MFYHIQPSWNDSVNLLDAKIWYHIRCGNSVNYEHLFLEDGVYKCSNQDDSFNLLSSNTCCIRHGNRGTLSTTTFQCADDIHENIFNIGKRAAFHVTSFDVNKSGQLAVTAASHGKAVILSTSSFQTERYLEGHLSEVTKCKFFPSGIVVLTGSLDMQLKVWCCKTGKCAATLRPGTAGSGLPSCDLAVEPGGHVRAIVDFDFIGLGRNVASIDATGHLCIWDVSCQVCVACFRLPVGGSSHSIAIAQEAPESLFSQAGTTEFEFLKSQNKAAHLHDVKNKLAAVACDKGVFLLKLDCCSSQRVALIQPQEASAVTQVAFVDTAIAQEAEQEDSEFDCNGSTGSSTSGLEEPSELIDESRFLMALGCANGRVELRDIREPTKVIWSFGAGQQPGLNRRVEHLRLFRWPNETAPLRLGLISASSDGLVLVHNIQQKTSNHIFQLTGVDNEQLAGLAITNLPAKRFPKHLQNSIAVWTATKYGVYRHYERLNVGHAFVDPFLESQSS